MFVIPDRGCAVPRLLMETVAGRGSNNHNMQTEGPCRFRLCMLHVIVMLVDGGIY